jgi:MFS family permease
VANRRYFGIEVVELVVYAISVTGVLANSVISPALPDIARELHVSSGGIGLIVALASVPGIVMAPVIGIAADRFGRRQIVVPCLVVFGVGGLLGMIAPTFRLLLLARLLQGFGGAGTVNLAVVILGDRYEGIERARAIGRNAAVLTGSIAVLPPIGGALAAIGGWRASFAPYSFALVMAVVVTRVLPDTRPAAPPTVRAQLQGARPYVLDRRVIAMIVTGFASFVLVFGLILTALPIDLKERFAAGSLLRGATLGLPAVGNVTAALLIGRLAHRWGTWTLTLFGFVVMAAAFTSIAAAPAVALVALCMPFYGFGEGLVIVPLQNYAAGLAPTAYRGVIVALWVASARAGQSLGPIAVGRLADHIGARTPFVLGAAVALVVAAGGSALRPRMATKVRPVPRGSN